MYNFVVQPDLMFDVAVVKLSIRISLGLYLRKCKM